METATDEMKRDEEQVPSEREQLRIALAGLTMERNRLLRESVEQQAISTFLSDVTCVASVTEGGVPELESVSDDFIRISGYTFDELNQRGGVPFTIHPDDMLIALGSLERVLSGQQDQGELRMLRKDGDIRWIRYLAQPEWDAGQGRVVRIRALAQDVTERKRAVPVALESERRFRQLAENINEVFWLSDPPRTQTFYVSPAYEKTWGRSCQSLYEQPLSFLDAIHPEDRQAVIATLEKHAQGELTQQEYRILRPDGAIRWILDRGFPIKNEAGQVCRVAGIAEDITERKRAQEALQETGRRKDEFLATLAHELRNPLAPIRNALQVMRLRGLDDPELAWARDLIERQIQQLTRLVDDLLDMSRITQGKIDLRKEVVDLATIVNRAVETTRPLIEERHHRLTVSLPPDPVRLEADPTRLEQILANLLNNAAKYTEPGGQVWLTAQRQGSQVLVAVRDTGIGIPAAMLPRVFDIFVQAEHTKDRAKGGLGIGLSLVHRLVDMHGGSVAARSAGPGTGSEFVVRLPVRVERQAAADAETPGASAGRPAAPARRILVVDDNVDAANSLAMLLRLEGHEVRVVHEGRSALEAVQAGPFEIIFLDIGLPGIDGYEVARRIRQQTAGARMVLAALTGWGQEEDRRRSKAAGFDHHLTKPVDLETLHALIAQAPEPVLPTK